MPGVNQRRSYALSFILQSEFWDIASYVPHEVIRYMLSLLMNTHNFRSQDLIVIGELSCLSGCLRPCEGVDGWRDRFGESTHHIHALVKGSSIAYGCSVVSS